MRHALALGRRGLGRVWPNPAVGCVLVKGARVIGRGWTQDGGRPHAEAMALAQAGAQARGATAYVTLEPCSHTGKTGPCSEALIAAGISRVVCALGDPDPRVNGKGFAKLRAAGVEVGVGLCEKEATSDQIGFLSRILRGRPMVTLKFASTLDGKIATASGESQWITGPLARRRVHADRAAHDGVMVGGGTARHDDPSLTVREIGHDRQPVRVVLSRMLDLPLSGALARTARDVPLWLIHGPQASPELRRVWGDLGAQLIEVPLSRGAVSASAALTALGERGLTRVYCEGGGGLAASLLAGDLVDEVHAYAAGAMIGAEGVSVVGALGLQHLARAPRFALQRIDRLGSDVLSIWRSTTPL
ncbi:bifunctional diaminohydroxyphosphoribosylaminopyrimidine deaminase/5-amino-6-(5-phosphoribosylamino)uracil reductase RibD [Aquimixticola soesokkakensis]|nr:bifunctional diaminohydroxyphosphoribosylaminopyrimidine deaminase/5-amino-6-(5-phosphoribosylamino)uracil reductase RibD [Aquimixticola soesokkakensis]